MVNQGEDSQRFEYVVDREDFSDQKFLRFKQRDPELHKEHNQWMYDFHGRVTQQSIKNFQLIPIKCPKSEEPFVI